MKMKYSIISTGVPLLIIILWAGALIADDVVSQQATTSEFPGLPIKVVEPPKNLSLPSTRGNVHSPIPRANNNMVMAQDAIDIEVSDGKNVFVDVATGYMNRFETPWDSPRLVAYPGVEHYIKGRNIYIAPEELTPIGVYITTGDEEDAISLTLIPKRIPGRVVRLKRAGVLSRAPGDASKWEMSSDYKTTIVSLLQNIAKGEDPPGYSRTKAKDSDAFWKCDFESLLTSPALSVLEGHRLRVLVSTVTNAGETMQEVEEYHCAQPGVRAVALWPSPLLGPGESSNLFIVVDRAPAGQGH